MALVNLTQILEDARKNHYAVPAFDVSNDEMIRAVCKVCEEERSPAIFMLLNVDMGGVGLKMLVESIKAVAQDMTVPVCIHHDHANSFAEIARSIDAGVTSVMIDGSMLPYEENMRVTKEVVDYAHSRGVTVEAELGHVGNAIPGMDQVKIDAATDDDIDKTLTDPEDARHFIEQTGVDCLAVAIGTAHGVYVSTPTLRLNLLKKIDEACARPLVMHGGSGTPDEDVCKAIALGITKINIYSEVLAALNTGLKETLDTITNPSTWPCVVFAKAGEKMCDAIRGKIRTFGSNGRY